MARQPWSSPALWIPLTRRQPRRKGESLKMGELVAYIGLFVVLGGLVGMVAPRLLRLQRWVHALAVAVAGFVLIGFGASQQQAAVRERARAARAATEAAAVAVPETPAERADRGIIGASVRCVDVVERLARFSYRWTDGFLEPKLTRWRATGNPNVFTYLGDSLEFQNGSGAWWQRYVYECDYDVEAEVVIDARAQPGRLPALNP